MTTTADPKQAAPAAADPKQAAPAATDPNAAVQSTADGTNGSAKTRSKATTGKKTAGKSRRDKNVTLTTTSTATTGGDGATMSTADKGFFDAFSGIIPDLVSAGAGAIGIDPRLAGQTVSTLMNVFGIGGGKAFTPAVSKEYATTQLKSLVTPYAQDPDFIKALNKWMQAAIEPVQAQKQGKAFTPADLSKSWLSDIGDAISNVNWGQVAQVGLQALPYVVAAL